MSLITLDQNPRVIRAWESVTQTTYEHYDFWLKIGMALHFEATRLGMLADGLRSFHRWSETDPSAYTGEADVDATWQSFGDAIVAGDEPAITYRTIEAMVRRLEFNWATLNPKTGLPDQSSLQNMEILLSHYSVQLYQWPGLGYFIGCDPDVLQSIFVPTAARNIDGVPAQDGILFGLAGPFTSGLRLQLGRLAQTAAQWRGSHTAYTADMEEMLVSKSLPFYPAHRWLTTPPNELPAILAAEDMVFDPYVKRTSTFAHFLSAFKFMDTNPDAVALSVRMLRAMLMQLVKLADPTAAREHNEGMVILVGPEASHKTSFFKWLIPSALSQLTYLWVENTTSDKNKRDFNRALTSSALVLMDECDSVLNGDDVASWLKAVLTQTSIEYTEIYSKTKCTAPRTALIAGTTNSKNLWLSNSGNRRMWLIEVEDIDLTFLSTHISRYWLYRSLMGEYNAARANGERPWLMSSDDFGAIRASNATMSARNSLSYDLEDELAPYTKRTTPMRPEEMSALVKNPQRADHPHLFNTKRVRSLLRLRGVDNRDLANTAKLRHELARISQAFTGHRNRVIVFGTGETTYVYQDGELHYSDRRAWLLPAWRDEGT